VGAIVVRVLWPPAEPAAAHAGEDANLRTIVADVQADGWRALLTADSESVVLSRLALRPVDLLKVSHHGSADPGLPAVLARLRPRLASIPVGRRNSYGHPAPATLAALAAAHVPTLRTDRDGTIRVEPRGGRDPVLAVRADHRALDVAVHR